MRFIRWSGLLVFVVVVTLVAAFWLLLVDWLVERAIEETGTELVGARVDLDAADLSLFPAGLELTRLQVTNPSQPMTNAVEVARIAGSFDLLQSLIGRTIVEELAVESVRFGTPRERSGEISGRRTVKLAEQAMSTAIEKLELPRFELPDRDAMFAAVELQSMAQIDALRAEVDAEQARWKARLDELPDKADLDRYRERLAELKAETQKTGPDAVAAVGQVTSLVGDIKKDVSALEQSLGSFQQELADLKQRQSDIVQARAKDLAALQARYGLSTKSLTRLTGVLLGPKVESLVAQGLSWYERLSPLWASLRAPSDETGPVVVEPLRGRSVKVRYPETSPLPDLLIRRIDASVLLDAGSIGGEIRDLTPEQAVLGRPTTAHFASDALRGIGSVRLDAVLDHVRPAEPRDELTAKVDAYTIETLTLSSNERWPIQLSSGRADFDAAVVMTAGGLDAKLGMTLREARIETDFPDGPLPRALGDVLTGIRRFRVDVGVTGDSEDYEIAIRSDLDDSLRGAAEGIVRGQLDQLNAELRTRLDERLADSRKALDAEIGGLSAIGDSLTSRIDAGQKLLTDAAGAGAPRGLSLPKGLGLP